jgi:hypothetical protein
MGRLATGRLRPATTLRPLTAVTRRPAATLLRRAPGLVEPGSGHLGRGQPQSRRPSPVRLRPVQPGLAKLSSETVQAAQGTPALALLARAHLALASPLPAGIPVTQRRPAAAAPAAAAQHRPQRPGLRQRRPQRPSLGQHRPQHPNLGQRRISQPRISRRAMVRRGTCPPGASPARPSPARVNRSLRPRLRPRQHR